MDIVNQVIEFCPDTRADCIGPECAAFSNGMKMLSNVTPLLFKLNPDFDIKEPIPLVLYINAYHCQKYHKFLDHESMSIVEHLNLEFEEETKSKELGETDEKNTCNSCSRNTREKTTIKTKKKKRTNVPQE
jgi:hypothetical protein